MDELLKKLKGEGINATELTVRQAIQKIGSTIKEVLGDDDLYENVKQIVNISVSSQIDDSKMINQLFDQIDKTKTNDLIEQRTAGLQNVDSTLLAEFENAVNRQSDQVVKLAAMLPNAITIATAEKLKESQDVIEENYRIMEAEILKMMLGGLND